jgi:hypothetical protein
LQLGVCSLLFLVQRNDCFAVRAGLLEPIGGELIAKAVALGGFFLLVLLERLHAVINQSQKLTV